MSLAGLFRKRALVLPPKLEDTVAAWKRLPPAAHSAPAAKTDWLVLDTETSGVDPERDRLLAIGACRLRRGAIDLSESVEVSLRQDQPSAYANVLIHGIGHQAQASGDDPQDALVGFLTFAGKSVVAGFHTLFDVRILQREMRERLGVKFRPSYVDLALLLPALFTRPSAYAPELDAWLQHFGVRNFARHSALGDALCTAELLLIALRQAQRRGIASVGELARLQKAQLELSRYA